MIRSDKSNSVVIQQLQISILLFNSFIVYSRCVGIYLLLFVHMMCTKNIVSTFSLCAVVAICLDTS